MEYFIIGQLVALVGIFIRWYISHDRLNSKVRALEKCMENFEINCRRCYDSTHLEISKVRSDVEDDLKEIRRDMKEMSAKLEQIPMIYLAIEKLRTELIKEHINQ